MIDKDFLNKISNISWFNNCGNPINNNVKFDVTYVSNWDEARRHYTAPIWEDTTLEAHNTLSVFLNDKYKSDFANWNKIAKEGRSFLENEIKPKIDVYRENNNLDNTFIHCVQWDLLHAILEFSYSKFKNWPEFFLELLKVYESGNFPCGWIGAWPNGKLIIL